MSESPHPLFERLNNSALIRFLLLFACGWAVVELLAYFEMVVVVFSCATILAFLLSYPVGWVSRYLPRGIAATLVFSIALIILGVAIATLGITVLSQGERLVDNITELLDSLNPLLNQIEQRLEQWNAEVDFAAIEDSLRERAIGLVTSGLAVIQVMLTNLIHLILIAVVAFFMLLDGNKIWQLILRAVPYHLHRRLTVTIRRNLLGFFWGRLILSTFFGASTFIVFLLLGVPHAFIFAVVAGLFDLIPGIGATIGISLIALLMLTQSIWLPIQIVVVCILLQQVEENILLPHVMKGSLNISPVVMFFALLVGARIAGILGLFLSIPIAGIVVSLLEIEEMKARPVPFDKKEDQSRDRDFISFNNSDGE
ncbi:MAG: AI-2E family transporter [Thainema sp.]